LSQDKRVHKKAAKVCLQRKKNALCKMCKSCTAGFTRSELAKQAVPLYDANSPLAELTTVEVLVELLLTWVVK